MARQNNTDAQNERVARVASDIVNGIHSVMTGGRSNGTESRANNRQVASTNNVAQSRRVQQTQNTYQPAQQTQNNWFTNFLNQFGNNATQQYHQNKIAEQNAKATETLLSGQATKNYEDKSKVGAALTGGYKMSQEEINNIGEYIDKKTNQRADVNYIDALAKEINTKNDFLTQAYTDLNGAYQRGEVGYNDYIKQFENLEKERNGLNQNIEKMNGFEYKSGMDYYNWLKENGSEDEIRDFEHYVSSYDDSALESIGNSLSASITEYYSHPIQAYEMIRSVIDRDFDYSSDDALSTQMKQVSDELRSYTLNGANDTGFRRYSLATIESLMPMVVETMHASFIGNAIGLEGKTYNNFVNQSVQIGMGVGSMSDTFKRRLAEGNSFETSLMNAAAHGFITYATEAFNVGGVTNLADFFAGAGGMGVLGDGLLSLPRFTAMLYQGAKDFAGEGIEEIAEAYGDKWVDSMMANMTGESIQSDSVQWGVIGDNGLTDQFIMAGAGALLMGVPSNVVITVDSAKKYHASGEAVKYWNQFADYYNSQGDVQNAGVCQSIAQTIEQERQTYAQKSATTGVLLQEDIPTPAPSVEEALNAVANAMKLDVDDQIQNIEKAKASAIESLQTIDNELVRRGYGGKINLDTYLKATPEVRNASKNILDFANSIGADVMITDNFLAKENGNITVKQMDEGKHGVTINGKQIIINPFATDIVNNANEIMEQVLSHEITHTTEKSGKYSKLKQAVYEALGKSEWDKQYNELKARYEKNGVKLTKEGVEAEIVARYVGTNMGNSKLLRNIANYNREGFSSIFTKMNTLLSNDPNSQIAQAFFNAYTDARKMVANPGTPQYSVGTIFQALGMTVEKDTEHTITAVKEDGTKTRKISTDDVINSPMGQMLRESVNYGNITEEEMNGQVEMLTNICNSLLQQQDADLFWAISGSIGYMPLSKGQNTSDVGNNRAFSAFTGNADPQYSETFDVITICTKTQQLIDVASAAMVKLNRGLTQKEIIDIVYNEVNKHGEPVPCPVCYVFSRWVGLGGVLNDIKNYQEKYRGADLDALKKRYTELCKEVDKLVGVKGKTFGKAQEALREQYDNEVQQRYSDLYSKDVTEQLGGKKMSAEEKAEYESLKKDLEILNDWSWVTNVLLDVHTNKGKRTIELNKKWLEMGEVPPDILFNLNRGEDFSKYAAWNYRTTRGAALGKTISPYTDMVLGQTILGMASPSRVKNLGEYRNQEKNAFLDMEATGEQFQEYGKAVQNTRMQNLKGGSRAQSTSDFRFEFVTDYLLHFMQLQAIGSYGQTYTKVPEAVPMLCSVGYEVNMSLMPKGKGFVEAKEGDPYAYYVKGFKGVKDGWYTLDFSDKTGINHTEAFYLREQYDNAQTIMVGINDVHNYLSRLDPRVDFIIPYHASGGTEVNYQSMMATLEEAVVEGARTSYEDNQNDKRVKNPTVEQEQAYNLREKIIKGEAAHLSEEEKEVLYRSNFLSDLWRRFYEPGYDSECYGVKMDDVAIFPYEYWDKNSTRETADINGRRFRDYCYELGIEPRFSQWVDEPGYWKTLIDRSMYNNDGTFHQQQAIKLDNFSTDFLYRGKMEKGLVQPENATKTFNRGRTSEIVDAVMDRLQYDISPETEKAYDKAVRNNDMETAAKYVRQAAEDYAKRTGQYMFDTFHGTNARFNRFDPEKRGSKNIFAESAYKGFFSSGSRKTAEAYTGLNSGDMFRIALAGDSDEKLNRIRKEINDKYGLNELDEKQKEGWDAYYKNALNEARRNGDPDLAVLDRLEDPEVRAQLNMSEEKIKELVDSITDTTLYHWNARKNPGEEYSNVNRLRREYEETDAYKEIEAAKEKGNNELNDRLLEYFGYEPNVKHMFAFMKDPLFHDFHSEKRDEAFSSLLNKAIKNGNDGAVFENVQDGSDEYDTIYVVFDPTQYKSADPVTYDDNGNVIPLSKRFDQSTDDLRYSIGETGDDNYGYHYGAKNLDYNHKSERLWRRGGRGTGAFGTGTYFFGEGRFKSHMPTATIRETGQKAYTEHKADFSKYNLFKPKNYIDGINLHDIFRDFDNSYRYANKNSLDEYLQNLENVRNDMLAFVGEEEADPNEPKLDLDSIDLDSDDWFEEYAARELKYEQELKEYKENLPDNPYDLISQEDDEYEHFLNSLVQAGMPYEEAYEIFRKNTNDDGDVNLRDVAGDLVKYYINHEELMNDRDEPASVYGRKMFPRRMENVQRLSEIVGVDANKLYDIVRTAMLQSEAETHNKDFYHANYDSVGTKIMKALGYEGIDVRHIPELDNSTYGSVIYDLNPDTVQYDISDDSGGNGPIHVEGEVVDGYGEKKKQQFRESNIEKSSVLNERQKERTRQMSADGYFRYMSVKNKAEIEFAKSRMEKDGDDKTFEDFMNNNNPSYKSVIQGELLLQKLAADNDSRWEDVAIKLADDSTVLGQGLQAYAIMQRLTPQGQLVAIQRNLKRMQAEMDERYGNKAPQLTLNPKLLEDLKNATPEEATKVREEILKDLYKQQPITITSMINTWRYLAMLGNPRTHVRNFLGNGVFMPAIGLKNAIGTVLEKAMGSKLKNRTKAIVSRVADRPLYEAGQKVYDEYKGLMEKDQKYEHTGFTEKTPLGKGLNKLADWNTRALDFEDMLFSKDRFALSYASFLKANNLTPDNISPEMKIKATAYAWNESLKATYRDANKLAAWLNRLEMDKGMKGARFFKQAILPFTKTPFNIVKRGVEYSPIGLLKSIYDGATAVRNGTMDANTWIDEMASGLSGTAIAGLGWLLARMGLFRTKDDDKDRKKYFDQDNGEQDYALDLGNGTYTIDWMSPVIMPLAIGAELYNMIGNEFDQLSDIDDANTGLDLLLRIGANISDPIVETSMLSGLKDSLSSYSTEGSAYFGDVITSAIASYIGQMFPTFGGQIARTFDDTRRSTTPNKGLIDKTWRQIRNKIPGLSQYNEPYINKQGQEEKTEDLGMDWVGRAFLNMVSPGYYSSRDIDKYDEELYRLYDATGEIDVLPSSTTKSVTFDNATMKFTPEEYTEWHKTRWQFETQYVNQFLDSQTYKNMDDAERVKTIDDIRDYAQKVAKKQFLETKGYVYTDDKELAKTDSKYIYDKEMTNVSTVMDAGVDLYAYYDYIENAGTKQAEKVAYLEGMDLTQAQKEKLYGLSGYKTSYQDVYNKNSKGSSKKKSGKSSYKRKSSGGSKKRSRKRTGGISISKSPGKARFSAKAVRPGNLSTPQVKQKSQYLSAYSSVMNRGSKNVSSASSGTVTCPRCGNRVSSSTGRCPICGAKL